MHSMYNTKLTLRAAIADLKLQHCARLLLLPPELSPPSGTDTVTELSVRCHVTDDNPAAASAPPFPASFRL